jgi:hypothetical protein
VTTIQRVPLDFDWPIGEVWHGYLMPDDLLEAPCPDCDSTGWSPEARHLQDRWSGRAPFHPTETGSTPLTVDTPAARTLAERNVAHSPWYYGSGEAAVRKEAQRLADLWNAMWQHHLAQEDVDTLVEAGRLMNFTHTWDREARRWVPQDPVPVVTAEQVNRWSISAMGHDAVNRSIVVRARCEQAGHPVVCGTCGGRGTLEKYEGQRAAAEAWEPTDPPTGEGWQAWEDVSEGSPVSPVFPDREGLVRWFMSPESVRGARERPLTRREAEALVDAGWSVGSLVVSDGQVMDGDSAVLALQQEHDDN